MNESLDKDELKRLMREADAKYYASIHKKHDYTEHLDFTAEYLAKHYNKESRHGKLVAPGRHKAQRQDSPTG